MDKLNRRQAKTVLPNLAILPWVKGNRNPKGTVMIIFNTTCLTKSPLPDKTSINGTKFIGT